MRSFLTGAVCALFLAVSAVSAHAADPAAAKTYVNDVSSQAVSIIKDTRAKKLTLDQAKVNFRQILNDSFDVPTIAKFTLGKYWRVANEAERAEFTRLLQTTILDKYADRLLEASGDRFSVDSATPMTGEDIEVHMTGYLKTGEAVGFDWRLRPAGDSFKIIDLKVEGVSMSITHRSDFASVIERNGGRVQALLDALKNRKFSK